MNYFKSEVMFYNHIYNSITTSVTETGKIFKIEISFNKMFGLTSNIFQGDNMGVKTPLFDSIFLIVVHICVHIITLNSLF